MITNLRRSSYVIVLAALVIVPAGASLAEWVAATPVTNNGSGSYDPSTCNCGGAGHFGGLAIWSYSMTYANQYGFTWICDQYNAFSSRAEAMGTVWTKGWNWVGCDPVPADESTMDITIQMTWALDGNCNNFWLSAAYAKTYAHSQVVINSAPDNAGDYTGEGEWSGEKREGDTWSGGLSLDWDKDGPGGGVSLSWSSDPTDQWQSGPTTKSNRYLQNVKNTADGNTYEYINVTIGLLSEVETATDTNAYHACANTKCEVTNFTLSQPQ